MDIGFLKEGNVFVIAFDKADWHTACELLQHVEATDEESRQHLLKAIERLANEPVPNSRPNLRLI